MHCKKIAGNILRMTHHGVTGSWNAATSTPGIKGNYWNAMIWNGWFALLSSSHCRSCWPIICVHPFIPCPRSILREIQRVFRGFPGGSVVKNPSSNAGDMGSIPDPRRSHMPQSNKACAPRLLSLCSRTWKLRPRSPRASTTAAQVP